MAKLDQKQFHHTKVAVIFLHFLVLLVLLFLPYELHLNLGSSNLMTSNWKIDISGSREIDSYLVFFNFYFSWSDITFVNLPTCMIRYYS